MIAKHITLSTYGFRSHPENTMDIIPDFKKILVEGHSVGVENCSIMDTQVRALKLCKTEGEMRRTGEHKMTIKNKIFYHNKSSPISSQRKAYSDL